jgi:hypothetical protein
MIPEGFGRGREITVPQNPELRRERRLHGQRVPSDLARKPSLLEQASRELGFEMAAECA